jgi:hypothetical protein
MSMTDYEFVTNFLDDREVRPVRLLTEDQPEMRLGLARQFRTAKVNLPREFLGIARKYGVQDNDPEGKFVPFSEKGTVIPFSNYDGTTEALWRFFMYNADVSNTRVSVTSDIRDIRIEDVEGVETVIAGVDARYDLAGFHDAPIIYWTAFPGDIVRDAFLPADGPLYLVEKAATTMEEMVDIVEALEFIHSVNKGLEESLATRGAYLEDLRHRLGGVEYNIRTTEDILAAINLIKEIPEYNMFSYKGVKDRLAVEETFERLQKAKRLGTYDPYLEMERTGTKMTVVDAAVNYIRNQFAVLRSYIEAGSPDDGPIIQKINEIKAAYEQRRHNIGLLNELTRPTMVGLAYAGEQIMLGVPPELGVVPHITVQQDDAIKYPVGVMKTLALCGARVAVAVSRGYENVYGSTPLGMRVELGEYQKSTGDGVKYMLPVTVVLPCDSPEKIRDSVQRTPALARSKVMTRALFPRTDRLEVVVDDTAVKIEFCAQYTA